ncbi:GIY-YIG nuclease family protein [Actinacidiphila sp. SB3-2]
MRDGGEGGTRQPEKLAGREDGRGRLVGLLVGSLDARPVKIGTTNDLAERLRDLHVGSPVPLHVMWQTRGGRNLERALHQRFAAYRKDGVCSTSARIVPWRSSPPSPSAWAPASSHTTTWRAGTFSPRTRRSLRPDGSRSHCATPSLGPVARRSCQSPTSSRAALTTWSRWYAVGRPGYAVVRTGATSKPAARKALAIVRPAMASGSELTEGHRRSGGRQ